MARSTLLKSLVGLCLAIQGSALALGPSKNVLPMPRDSDGLQNIVTWDEHSLFVNGERILFYSGEFHPFRLPVPGLWLDVFQKIKAMGYNGVSFYSNWALLEGQPGVFRSEGIFAFDDFFTAAKQAGIYLLARPGPYINAEITGGGFPGWLQRIDGQLRTNDSAYLDATDLYAHSIGEIIAEAQITKGGPVILLQPENEYTQAEPGIVFPNPYYFSYVENQFRNASIVVPLISNDAAPDGHFAENTGLGGVGDGLDIYGYDSYPLGFDCANPTDWPNGDIPTDFETLHEEQSPITPNSIVEFQGGSFDPWGGAGFNKCAELFNEQFNRVFDKNDFSFGVTILNYYMTYGGTNWGNQGHPNGYTSYDYGAAIAEDRTVTREKYSEAKLEANFLMASPAYLVAKPGNATTSGYANTNALTVTPLVANATKFYVLRHSAYNSFDSTPYNLTLPTSQGNISIPQLGGSLTLNGRDSKIHVSDYNVGNSTLLYSTAEIFTWKNSTSKTVLIVYGGPGEEHEFAFVGAPQVKQLEGPSIKTKTNKNSTVVNWQTSSTPRVLQVGNAMFVYVLDRNTAYDYWTLPAASTDVVARAGYLLRNATVSGSTLALVGDVNATTPLEVVFGAPQSLKTLTFNGQSLQFNQSSTTGAVTASIAFAKPTLTLPSLTGLDWKYLNSLPEIQPGYDDSLWTKANLTKTPNIANNLSTPTSLFASDYGYNCGSLLYRGHFTSGGNESKFTLMTQGGLAFGHSIWLNKTFVGSWVGNPDNTDYQGTYTLPTLQKGQSYVFTILIDHLGLDENGAAGDSGMKNPRGILNYTLSSRPQSAISWKLTGNLGGEEYRDISRGPLNEGAMYAERQGYHLPDAPSSGWASSTPTDGIEAAGVGFYYTSFDLALPTGYDIPLSFMFSNTTGTSEDHYRVQLFVNGYQFGKYINSIGPQTTYPVPEGILNHQGTNYVGMTLWAQDAGGAKLTGLSLVADGVVQSGYGAVVPAPQDPYQKRQGAY